MSIERSQFLRKIGICTLVIYSICVLAFQLRYSIDNLDRFLRHRGQTQQILSESRSLRRISEINRILPPESLVASSLPRVSYFRVLDRYYLYPHQFVDRWQYFIDYDNVNEDHFPGAWLKHRLTSGDTVYAVDGKQFVRSPAKPAHVNQGLAFLIFLLITAFKVLTGYLYLSCINIQINKNDWAGYLSMSYLSGELILTSLVWLHLMMGGDLIKEGVMLIWGYAVLLLIVTALLKKRSFPSPFRQIVNPKRVSWPAVTALVLLLILSAAIAVKPITDWDAMSFWIMKSKVIHHQQALDLSYTHNNHYPLLWPLSIAIQFNLLGTAFDPLAQWSSALFFLVLVAQIISAMRTFNAKGHMTAAGILFFLTAFYYWEVMHTANAEKPFLAYTAALVTALVAWIRSPKSTHYAVLALAMAFGVTMVKFEGFLTAVFAGVTLLALIVFRRLNPEHTKLALRLLVLIPLLYFFWVWWININGFGASSLHFKTMPTPEKLRAILSMSVPVFVKSRVFAMICFAVLFLRIKKNKAPWSPEEWFLLGLSCLLLGFSLCFAYLGLTEDHINRGAEAVIRLSLHAAPALMALWYSRMYRQENSLTSPTKGGGT